MKAKKKTKLRVLLISTLSILIVMAMSSTVFGFNETTWNGTSNVQGSISMETTNPSQVTWSGGEEPYLKLTGINQWGGSDPVELTYFGCAVYDDSYNYYVPDSVINTGIYDAPSTNIYNGQKAYEKVSSLDASQVFTNFTKAQKMYMPGSYTIYVTYTLAQGNDQLTKTESYNFTITDSSALRTLTYGTDSNGVVTDWLLRGDASRDANVTAYDSRLINEFNAANINFNEDKQRESATIETNGIGYPTSNDSQAIIDLALIGGNESKFDFYTYDTPNTGYHVTGVTITTVSGAKSLAIPEKGASLTTDGYTVSIDDNGICKVTGVSSEIVTNVYYIHEKDATPQEKGTPGKVTPAVSGTKTSDESNLPMGIALLSMALAAMGVLVATRRKAVK